MFYHTCSTTRSAFDLREQLACKLNVTGSRSVLARTSEPNHKLEYERRLANMREYPSSIEMVDLARALSSDIHMEVGKRAQSMVEKLFGIEGTVTRGWHR